MGQAKLLVRLRSEAGRKYKRPISRTGTFAIAYRVLKRTMTIDCRPNIL